MFTNKTLGLYRWAIQLFPIILFLYTITYIPDELINDAFVGCLGLFLVVRFFLGKSISKEIEEIKNIPLTRINQLRKGKVKVKGKIRGEIFITSELTKTKCIGYSYSEKRWIKKKSGLKYNLTTKKSRYIPRDSKKLKTIQSKIECEDFYFRDNTGEIFVSAEKIEMLISYNSTREQKNGIFYSENILQENKEYYLIGYFDQKNNQISKGKELNKKGEFFIIDPKNFDMLNGGSKNYRIGCGILLLIIIIGFFGFLSKDYWLYLIEQLK